MAVYAGTMLCPACGDGDTRVIDSRPAEDGQSIRRRRHCENCSFRFTTYERSEPQLMVRKRSGRLEPFSAPKLAAGISASLADRPLSGSDIHIIVEEVEESLRVMGPEVESEDVGREVLARLKGLDEVAYLRFASVYKEFKDVTDFEKELAELESTES